MTDASQNQPESSVDARPISRPFDAIIITIHNVGNRRRGLLKWIPTYVIETMKTFSYFCVSSFSCRALYEGRNYGLSTCPFLYIALVTVFCHGLLGVLHDYTTFMPRHWYEKFRVLATTIPIAMLNAQMQQGTTVMAQQITTIIGATVVPFILEVIFPKTTGRIIDVIVLSNVCSLGFKSVDRDFRLGVYASCWHALFYLLSRNAASWLGVSEDLPFNIGLCGMTIFTSSTMKATA